MSIEQTPVEITEQNTDQDQVQDQDRVVNRNRLRMTAVALAGAAAVLSACGNSGEAAPNGNAASVTHSAEAPAPGPEKYYPEDIAPGEQPSVDDVPEDAGVPAESPSPERPVIDSELKQQMTQFAEQAQTLFNPDTDDVSMESIYTASIGREIPGADGAASDFVTITYDARNMTDDGGFTSDDILQFSVSMDHPVPGAQTTEFTAYNIGCNEQGEECKVDAYENGVLLDPLTPEQQEVALANAQILINHVETMEPIQAGEIPSLQ